MTVAIALTCTMPRAEAAQKTVVRPGVTETTTALIEKIDTKDRFLLLRGDDGEEVGVFAPPELPRFTELRVGDRVTITYYESTIYQLKGRHAPRPSAREEIAGTESASPLPGVTFSHQVTERVTVKAVDRKAASITVADRSGQTVTRRVDDPSHLDGVTPGDHIDITYTQAILATITRTK
jgi:hypothetical protein